MTPVSIVIPTWNGRRLLEEFLPSVIDAARAYAAASSSSVEVVIVDDGSEDGTVEWLAQHRDATPVIIRTIRHDTNLGFGEACNRGVRESAHPLVLLLNNDIAVSTGAIAPLVKVFEGWREATPLFGVHCQVFDETTPKPVGTGKMGGFSRGFLRVHQSFQPRGSRAGAYFSIFASGGSALFDRSIFLALGGFDPLFAPFYFEDVELSYRAWKRGFAICYEPESVVRHRFSATIGPSAGRRRIQRIGQRNRLILHWMHLHDGRMFASHVAWTTVLLAGAVVTFRFQFVRAFADALQRLSIVRTRRHEERQRARRTDREVLGVFRGLAGRPDVQVYDRKEELQ